jgi:dinuclear metal center YbgI/SA1388 family protein
MSKLAEITKYADHYLRIASFHDYCPNGLQVEGKQNVVKLASAVTASLAVIEQAVEWGADCLIVHHGYFWKNERAQVVGMKKHRLQALLGADVSLLAYHLPLDAHPVVGNNAQIANRLSISELEPLQKTSKTSIGNVGMLDAPLAIEEFVGRCAQILANEPTHIDSGPRQVQRIAWCTGGAQHMIDDAVERQADVYLTGEISEQTVHIARECNIHFIAAGHHATERYGVQAMSEHLADKFSLEHRYFDEINPA